MQTTTILTAAMETARANLAALAECRKNLAVWRRMSQRALTSAWRRTNAGRIQRWERAEALALAAVNQSDADLAALAGR